MPFPYSSKAYTLLAETGRWLLRLTLSLSVSLSLCAFVSMPLRCESDFALISFFSSFRLIPFVILAILFNVSRFCFEMFFLINKNENKWKVVAIEIWEECLAICVTLLTIKLIHNFMRDCLWILLCLASQVLPQSQLAWNYQKSRPSNFNNFPHFICWGGVTGKPFGHHTVWLKQLKTGFIWDVKK